MDTNSANLLALAMPTQRNKRLDFVRILTSERLGNGDKPFVICCIVEDGQNIQGEYVILFENSSQIRLGSIESTIYSLNDNRSSPLMDRLAQGRNVFEQLKNAIVVRLDSIRPSSDESNIGLAKMLNSHVLLRELSNAYLQLFELCSLTNGRERLDYISQITKSEQLKKLIKGAIKDLPAA